MSCCVSKATCACLRLPRECTFSAVFLRLAGSARPIYVRLLPLSRGVEKKRQDDEDARLRLRRRHSLQPPICSLIDCHQVCPTDLNLSVETVLVQEYTCRPVLVWLHQIQCRLGFSGKILGRGSHMSMDQHPTYGQTLVVEQLIATHQRNLQVQVLVLVCL